MCLNDYVKSKMFFFSTPGTYGRLGHGTSDDLTHPTLVNALKGYHVTHVACGYGDAQTLAATDKGKVGEVAWLC